MNANELRIGNLVDCFGICEVIGISLKKIKVRRKTQKGNYLIEKIPINSLELNAINLDEDCMLKFGFKENEFSFVFEFDQFYTHIQDGVVWYNTVNDSIAIEYVHELQNLYNALTFKELKRVDGF